MIKKIEEKYCNDTFLLETKYSYEFNAGEGLGKGELAALFPEDYIKILKDEFKIELRKYLGNE